MKRVLIVEDTKVLWELFNAALKGDGYELKFAANGQEGLALVRAEQFDLIITDDTMPVMSGHEMVKMIRLMEGDKMHTPIIMASSNAGLVCEELGVDAVVHKPMRFLVLRMIATSFVAGGDIPG